MLRVPARQHASIVRQRVGQAIKGNHGVKVTYRIAPHTALVCERRIPRKIHKDRVEFDGLVLLYRQIEKVE